MGFCIRLRKLERVLLPLNSEKRKRRNGRTLTFLDPVRELRAQGTRGEWVPTRDSPQTPEGEQAGVPWFTCRRHPPWEGTLTSATILRNCWRPSVGWHVGLENLGLQTQRVWVSNKFLSMSLQRALSREEAVMAPPQYRLRRRDQGFLPKKRKKKKTHRIHFSPRPSSHTKKKTETTPMSVNKRMAKIDKMGHIHVVQYPTYLKMDESPKHNSKEKRKKIRFKKIPFM